MTSVAGVNSHARARARLTGLVPPAALRRGFGVFIIAMAALVLAKELA